jgi:hypothetical protein
VVFLIGCDHVATQTYPEGTELDDPQNTTQREFRELLVRAIEKHDPLLIAEESHPEFLKKRKKRSVVIEVASVAGVCHRFCDPSLEERRRLGISDGPPYAPPGWDNHKEMYNYFLREWPVREEFWIGQLGDEIQKRILIACGAGHRETLRRRLERRGILVKIIEKRFGATRIWDGDFPAYKAAYKDLRRKGFPPVTDCFRIGTQDRDTAGFPDLA